MARAGHQINIFLKKGLEWPVTLDHFDIRRVDINPVIFAAASISKVLKRRKKKKLEVLITDDLLFGKVLEALKVLHGSDVLITPDRDMLKRLLEVKTKQF